MYLFLKINFPILAIITMIIYFTESKLNIMQKIIRIDIIVKNSFRQKFLYIICNTDLTFLYISWKELWTNRWIITNTCTIHNNIIVASNGGLNARCFLSLSFSLFVFIYRNRRFVLSITESRTRLDKSWHENEMERRRSKTGNKTRANVFAPHFVHFNI